MAKQNKRGRPAVPVDERRSKNFTFRSRKLLHEQLQAAANRSGLSVSEEIESRLNQSFAEADFETRMIKLVFGSPEVFAILKIIGASMKETGIAAGLASTLTVEGGFQWLNNPYAFDQAVKAANTVFEALRPQGEIKPPKAALGPSIAGLNIGQIFEQLGAVVAKAMLEEAATGTSRTGSGRERANSLKKDFDALAKRLAQKAPPP